MVPITIIICLTILLIVIIIMNRIKETAIKICELKYNRQIVYLDKVKKEKPIKLSDEERREEEKSNRFWNR